MKKLSYTSVFFGGFIVNLIYSLGEDKHLMNFLISTAIFTLISAFGTAVFNDFAKNKEEMYK